MIRSSPGEVVTQTAVRCVEASRDGVGMAPTVQKTTRKRGTYGRPTSIIVYQYNASNAVL